ncbi:protein of unknown function [Stenotrophomonas maltophilia]|nr:protein of unknown function [Stenotrophomonas maltophilia]
MTALKVCHVLSFQYDDLVSVVVPN